MNLGICRMLKMYSSQVSKSSPNGKKKSFDVLGNQIYFISLGCPRNRVDTEVMLGLLLQRGYEPAEKLEEADFIVINTCGFLEESRKESLDTVDYAIQNKKKRGKVIVTGCMVQSHHQEVTDRFPKIDYLLGSGDVEGILRAVESDESGRLITDAKSYLEAGEVPRKISTPGHYAYLKIAEGCRKRCSYCIIPDIKGGLKSKSVERVIKEFRVLREQGIKEIILIAQDLGDWGKDLGFKRSEGLVHLLKEILLEKGDYWLRLLYVYPDEISDELIALMKEDSRICPYLDMPIQHINNRVLKSMRRATTREQIITILDKLRDEIEDITIRTSLIVGFPGETEEEFNELCEFVKEYQLDNVGIFKYSREPGSHADSLDGHLPEEIKETRHHKLMEIQQEVVEEINECLIDEYLEVVVEGYHPDSNLLMRGRHKGQCPEIDGEILINDGHDHVDKFGERYLVEITDVSGYDLIGRIVKKRGWKK